MRLVFWAMLLAVVFRVGRPLGRHGVRVGQCLSRSRSSSSNNNDKNGRSSPQPRFAQRLASRKGDSIFSSPVADAPPPLAGPTTPPLRVHLFVDGTWLYYTLVVGRNAGGRTSCPMTAKYGPRWQKTHEFRWSRLPQVVASQLQIQLNRQHTSPRAIEVVRTSIYTSALANTPIQGMRASMIEDWYRSNFEVHVLTTPNRDEPTSSSASVSSTGSSGSGDNSTYSAAAAAASPSRTQEKCVDIMVAVDMLYSACTNAYDVAVLVTGDKDFVPALQKTRLASKRVALASVRNSCNKDLTRQDLHIRDFDLIWLEDHLDRLMIAKSATLAGSTTTELRLYDLVVESLKSAEGHTITSRDLGRFLQTQQVTDETTGERDTALSLLKKIHGSIRSFLGEYSNRFKVSLTPQDYPDYSIQYLGTKEIADDGEDDYDKSTPEKEIDDVVGDDGLLLGHDETSSLEIESSRDQDEGEYGDEDDDEDQEERSGDELDLGAEELGRLTVSQLRASITKLGGKCKSKDTKAVLVAAMVDLIAQQNQKQMQKLKPKPKPKPEPKTSKQNRSNAATAKDETASEPTTSDDESVVATIKDFLRLQPDSEINSRDLGRHLSFLGFLDAVKDRHQSLFKFLTHCADQGEPLAITKEEGRIFSVRLTANARSSEGN